MQHYSTLAFFNLDKEISIPSDNTPAWVDHIALNLESLNDLENMKTCLVKANSNVIGTIDHGFIKSIYFYDLNGIRIEFTISAMEKKINYVRG